jgi:phosphoribosylformylglycinamidine cyclo-ligase
VDEEEMFRVFNMGVGFAAVVSAEVADGALGVLQNAGAPDARIIGSVKGDEAGRVLIPDRGLVGTRKEGFVRAG